MIEKDRIKLNEARLDLLHWVRENKSDSLKYANKIQLCDKINSIFIPLIETKKSVLPSRKETNNKKIK